MVLWELAWTAHEEIAHLQQVQLVVETVERADRRGEVGRTQPPRAGRLHERRASPGRPGS